MKTLEEIAEAIRPIVERSRMSRRKPPYPAMDRCDSFAMLYYVSGRSRVNSLAAYAILEALGSIPHNETTTLLDSVKFAEALFKNGMKEDWLWDRLKSIRDSFPRNRILTVEEKAAESESAQASNERQQISPELADKIAADLFAYFESLRRSKFQLPRPPMGHQDSMAILFFVSGKCPDNTVAAYAMLEALGSIPRKGKEALLDSPEYAESLFQNGIDNRWLWEKFEVISDRLPSYRIPAPKLKTYEEYIDMLCDSDVNTPIPFPMVSILPPSVDPGGREWNFRDDIDQYFFGDIPEDQPEITLTLNWKPNAEATPSLVGRYRINLQQLVGEGFAKRGDRGITLRFQRTGEIIEIAVNRASPALVVGRTPGSNQKT